ncbi:hypothetical protein Hanom_Chr04g00290311 [Helianthus anomalus]
MIKFIERPDICKKTLLFTSFFYSAVGHFLSLRVRPVVMALCGGLQSAESDDWGFRVPAATSVGSDLTQMTFFIHEFMGPTI